MENKLTREMLNKVRRIEVHTSRLVTDSLVGSYHSVFKGRGMNFEEVREYVPGDDIRTIDWNVTARSGIPHFKKFTEERELTIMLLIDISGSGEFGSTSGSKRELMAELGSVLAFSAVRNNDKVGLILFTGEVELYIAPKKGRRHILRIIREILYFKPQRRDTDINKALEFMAGVRKRRSIVFLISDFCLPGNFEQELHAMRATLQASARHHDLVTLKVSDPREYHLPDIGRINIEDAESGEQVELNTSRRSVREEFTRRAEERRDILLRTIRGAGIDLLDLATDRSYLPELMHFFNNRQRKSA